MISRDPSSVPSVANPDSIHVGIQYEKNQGAAYGEHIKNTAAICNTSASHTYGNVMAVIENYIIELFPKGLFNTVVSSTTLASRQLNHLPQQLQKKDTPIMVTVPRILFGQDDNRFLAHTQINSRFTNTHGIWGEGSLIPLAYDRNNQLWVHGHYNRAVMYVDVIMTFNTFAQQVNYMSFIHNMIPIGHPHFIRAPLELYLPEEFCFLISKLIDIPIKEYEDKTKKEYTSDDIYSVYKFLTQMNSMWYHPITYKLKGGSNSDEFFMYYIADIDTNFESPTAGPGIKDGQIRRNFDISFTVRCEFNTIGYLTLNSPKFTKSIQLAPTEDLAVLPIFSDQINLDDFQLPVGWSVLGWPIFKLTIGENSISIDRILNESLRTIIDYHLKIGLPMERFIKIEFRENGKILNDELFYIDWGSRKLILTNPNNHRTYRLIITTSHAYVNNLIKELYNLE